jgi:hypothetical protein
MFRLAIFCLIGVAVGRDSSDIPALPFAPQNLCNGDGQAEQVVADYKFDQRSNWKGDHGDYTATNHMTVHNGRWNDCIGCAHETVTFTSSVATVQPHSSCATGCYWFGWCHNYRMWYPCQTTNQIKARTGTCEIVRVHPSIIDRPSRSG